MKPWLETIRLAQPLRDVQLLGGTGFQPVSLSDSTHGQDVRATTEQLRESYERGRADGEKALSEQLLLQRAQMHELSQGFLTSLNQAVPQVVRATENMLISLALSVAQKLVADLPVSSEMVEAAVRDALSQVEGTAQFTIRLNPADLELLQKAESPLFHANDGNTEYHFVASAEVTRGGCLVQTRFGTVDARRETKLELLKRSLLA